MVPVYLNNERIGRFNVDLPPSQHHLSFTIGTYSEEPFSFENDENFGFRVEKIFVPLERRSLSVPNRLTAMMDTQAIVNHLILQGVPYPSENLSISENYQMDAKTYSWRVAKVTIDTLEKIFDLDEYVPE